MAVYVTIDCCDEKHTIGLAAGKRVITDPAAHDFDLELSLVEMGAEPCPCIRYWQNFSDSAELAMSALWHYKRGHRWLEIAKLGQYIVEQVGAEQAAKKLYEDIDYGEHVDEAVAALLERAKRDDTVDMGYWGDRDDQRIVDSIVGELQEAINDENAYLAMELVVLLGDLFPKVDPWEMDVHEEEYDNGLEGGVTLMSERTLKFFDRDIAEWTRAFEKRYFDEIYFHSWDEVEDLCEASPDYCTPEALGVVLFFLGFDEDEEPEVSEPYLDARPCAPAEAAACEYGVLYEPDLSNPYMGGAEWRETTVAAYDTYEESLKGIEQSQQLSDLRGDGNLYVMTPVRRVSEKKLAQAVRRVEEERKNWKLFGVDVVPELTDLDYLKLQWQPWDDHLEEMLQDDLLPEEEL
jgi:hypothetical protein